MATLRIGRVIKALGSDLREVDFTIDFLIIVAYTKGERGKMREMGKMGKMGEMGEMGKMGEMGEMGKMGERG
jgi:hypothetical protein